MSQIITDLSERGFLPAAVEARQVCGDISQVESSVFGEGVGADFKIWHQVLLKERTDNLRGVGWYPLINWCQALNYFTSLTLTLAM